MTQQGKLSAPGEVMTSGAVATSAPGDNPVLVGGGQGVRVITNATGGADGEVQVFGSDTASTDPLDWYELGPPMVFGANGSKTIYVDEPNTFIDAVVTVYVAGAFTTKLQRFS